MAARGSLLNAGPSVAHAAPPQYCAILWSMPGAQQHVFCHGAHEGEHSADSQSCLTMGFCIIIHAIHIYRFALLAHRAHQGRLSQYKACLLCFFAGLSLAPLVCMPFVMTAVLVVDACDPQLIYAQFLCLAIAVQSFVMLLPCNRVCLLVSDGNPACFLLHHKHLGSMLNIFSINFIQIPE